MTTLLSLLNSIYQQSQKLAECLAREKLALDESKYDELAELAVQKQSLLDELQSLDKQRETSCPTNNFNQFIIDSKDQTLISQWDIARDAIRQCQKQNEINGHLLSKHNMLKQETLAILTGRDKHSAQTYNAQGNQTNDNSLLDGVKA